MECSWPKTAPEKNANTELYLSQFDVVSLCETWTKNNDDVCDYMQEYECFCVHGQHLNKYGRNPGGLITFIKRDIAKHITLLKMCEYGLF